MPQPPFRAPITPDRFGPNGAAILAIFRGLDRLSNEQVERLAAVQSQQPIAFDMAWHAVYERAGWDVTAFQHVVSFAYGFAGARLDRGSLRDRLSDTRKHAFRLAVAGRALAFYAGPDAPADEMMALSRAWTTCIS